jgi:hypothetical protein
MEITENIITNICEMNEVAAAEERGVSHFSKTLKGAGSIVLVPASTDTLVFAK